MLILSILAAALHVSSAAAFQLCSLSNSYKPSLTDLCATGGGQQIAVNAARGEVEAGVVLLDNSGGSAVNAVTLTVSWDAGAAPAGVSVSGPLLVTCKETPYHKTHTHTHTLTHFFPTFHFSTPARRTHGEVTPL